MGIVEDVKAIGKIASKYFVVFSIIAYGFLFGWNYQSGKTIFSSITQDISILVNQGL